MFRKTLTTILLFGILGVLYSKKSHAQCSCVECPLPIPDNNSRNYILRVDTVQNDDLSSPMQGVCQINLSFQHSFVGDLNVVLSSPSGQTVTLIGPAPTTLSGQTDFSTWDVRFVSCDQNAFPDLGFSAVWSNNAAWGFFQTFSGSYYPHSGCLEDFDSGSVSGLWTLSISDKSQMDAGILTDFDIEFCDQLGLECIPCLADPGRVNPDSLVFCSGDSAINNPVKPDITFPGGPSDSATYFTTLVISRNDTIIAYTDSLLLSGAQPGVYQLCGFSYALEDSALIPKPLGNPLLTDLRQNLFGTTPAFCGSLSDSCMTVILLSTSAPLDTTVVLCAGDSFPVADTILNQSGVYEFELLASNGCDSTVRLDLTVQEPILNNLDTTICTGQKISIGTQVFDQEGTYEVLLPNASINGCDSTIILSLNVVDPVAIVAIPDVLSCKKDTVVLNGSASGPDSQIVYFWKYLSGSPPPVSQNESTLSVTMSGFYQLKVSIPNQGFEQCADSTIVFVAIDTVPPDVQVTASDSTLSCFITEIMLDASTSLPADSITFSWEGPGGFQSDLPTPFIINPGEYQVSISRIDNGCLDSAIIAIESDTSLPIVTVQSTTITCLDSLSILNGLIIPNFASTVWSGPNSFSSSSRDTFTQTTGLYTLTATLPNGCSASATTEVISDTLPPLLSTSASPITCSSSEANLYAESQSQDVSYLWLGPQFMSTSKDTSTITPGVYIVSATSPNGCVTIDSVAVTTDTMTPPLSAFTDTLNCLYTEVWLIGQSEADAIIEWEGQPSGDSLLVNQSGTYSVKATGTNGCAQSLDVQVQQDTTPPSFILLQPNTLNCLIPSVQLFASNGSSPNIRLSWVLPDGTGITNSDTITATEPGMYTAIAFQPSNYCTTTDSIFVTEDISSPVADSGSADTLTCLLDTVLLGGSQTSIGPNFEIKWFDESGTILSMDSEFQTSTPGTYSLLVTNTSNGCTDSAQITVIENRHIPMAEISLSGPITCENPIITLQATGIQASSDTAIFWILNDDTVSTLPTLFIDQSGLYTLLIENLMNGCKDTAVIIPPADTITPSIQFKTSQDNLSCFVTSTTLSIQDTGQGQYGFHWVSPDGKTGENPSFETSQGGTHTLMLTNFGNGCTTFDSLIIPIDTTSPTAIVLNTDILTCAVTEVTIDGSSSSGQHGLDFQWLYSQIPISAQQTITSTESGIYTLIVTDTLNGCKDTTEVVLAQDTIAPDLTIVPPDTLTCVLNSVPLVASISLPLDSAEIVWMPAISVSNSEAAFTEALTSGWIFLTVSNPINGCIALDSVFVSADTIPPSVHWNSPDTITCLKTNVTLQPSDSILPSNLVFEWISLGAIIETGGQTPSPVISSPGSLSVKMTNQVNGCFITDTLIILADTITPTVSLGPDTNRECEIGPLLIEGTFSPGATVQWEALNGIILEGASTLTPLVTSPGTYVATGRFPENGCTATDTIQIIQSVTLLEAIVMDDSFQACLPEPVFVSGNLPPFPFSGMWSSPTGTIFQDPDSSLTSILSTPYLPVHLLVWTLSTPECPDYDADTVILLTPQPPNLADDAISIPSGNTVTEILILANDLIPQEAAPVILINPDNGTLTLGSDGIAKYSSNPGFCGTDRFFYSACNPQCSNQCDTAIVLIEVNGNIHTNPNSDEIPNAITPNGDGNNDLFIIEFLEDGNCRNRSDSELVILNRWGDVVYSAKPYKNDWGGQGPDGSMLPQGTYYYILKLDVANGLILKGDITILR